MTDNSDYGPGVEDVPTTYRPEKGNEEAGLSSTLAASTDPEQVVLSRELWETLSLALSELPWTQRAAWLLREQEYLSYAEIARVLDVSPTVVRGQLHRARRTLAIRMEQWR